MRAGIRRALCRALAASLLLAACAGDGEPIDDGPLTDVTGQVADDEVDRDDDDPEPDDANDPASEDGSDADEANEREDDDASTDPYAVPDDPADIDDDYVDAVMNAILAAESEILQEILSREAGELPSEQQLDRLRALVSGRQLVKLGQDYADFARDEDRRSAFLSPEEFGTMAWENRRVMHADASCILTIGFLDLRETAVEPYSDQTLWVVVLDSTEPAGLDDRAAEVNPTPWRYHQDNIMTAGGEPIDDGEWDDLDYADRLDLPCEEYDQ